MIDIDKLIEEYENDNGPLRLLCQEAAQALIQQRKRIKNLEEWNKEMYENHKVELKRVKANGNS